MNGLEQRAHGQAVARVEKGLADTQLIVEQLAVDTVQHRDGLNEDLQVFQERLRVQAELEAHRLDAVDEAHARRLDRLDAFVAMFASMTLWQRIWWAVRGLG